jgi:hypothetical protein
MPQLVNSGGPSVTASESPKTVDKTVDKTVERRDRWSLWILGVGVLAVLLFWWCVVANAFGLFLLLLVVLFTPLVIGFPILIVVLAFMRRFRAALSALVAIAIMAGGVAVRGSIVNLARDVDFAVHRTGYERTVEAWRAKHPDTAPFRLVLEDIDASALVVPTVFDYVVYDESDAVGKDPPVISGDWLCAVPGWGANETMTMLDGAGIIIVRRLSGHFYFVEQTL